MELVQVRLMDHPSADFAVNINTNVIINKVVL